MFHCTELHTAYTYHDNNRIDLPVVISGLFFFFQDKSKPTADVAISVIIIERSLSLSLLGIVTFSSGVMDHAYLIPSSLPATCHMPYSDLSPHGPFPLFTQGRPQRASVEGGDGG